MTLTDTYTLSNGEKIPVVGFGTWQTPAGDVAEESVATALRAGYRHIDTAAIYGNEESVGKAIAKSGIPRNEIFITTKLWNDAISYDDAKKSIDTSLEKLGLDYLDLYLIHWPNPKANRPNNEKRNADVWRAMEDAVEDEKIKSIGVSNFHERHLTPLLATAKIKPLVNQIYLNPSDQQKDIVKFNKENGILTEAYSPLGTGKILELSTLMEIAEKYNKSTAQIALRWSLDKGFLPLPKSVTESRIIQNAELFDFDLTAEEINILDGLDEGKLSLNPDNTDF